MGIKFTREDGLCPYYIGFGRKWYIQDKDAGWGAYDYCLMSVPDKEPESFKFETKQNVAKWLKEIEYDMDDWDAKMLIGQHVVYSTQDSAILEKDGVEYSWDKTTNKVRRIFEPKQETGWFSKYYECLEESKKYISKFEATQLDLFDMN